MNVEPFDFIKALDARLTEKGEDAIKAYWSESKPKAEPDPEPIAPVVARHPFDPTDREREIALLQEIDRTLRPKEPIAASA